METSQDERYQTKSCEPGAVTECIVHGNEDLKVKSASPRIKAGDFDACNFTAPKFGTPTNLLECPTDAADSNGISCKESRGCAVANYGGFPVSFKSACPMTISEADLSKCGKIGEGNDVSVENNDNTVENSVQHENGDFIVHKLTPLVNGYGDEDSKCLGGIQGKVSSVENGRGSSDTAANNSLSRERKKSKYLCYPFINLSKGSKVLSLSAEYEIDDSKILGNNSIQHGDSSSLVKCSKKKRDSRKLTRIAASSAELLIQLHMVARDHLIPYCNSDFDPTELLFNRFRASVFCGLSNSEVMGIVDIQNDKAQRKQQNKIPAKKMRKEKSKTVSFKKPPSGLYDANVNISSNSQLPVDCQMGVSPSSSNMKTHRKRKRKELTMLPSLGPNKQYCNNDVQGDPGQKKRMRGKGTTPGISYSNGNNAKPISLEVCLQDAGPYPMAAISCPNSDVPTSPGFCGTKPEIPAPLEFQTPGIINTTDTNDKSSAELTLDQMKRSLEFMRSVLDKSANTISPESRASLENEIKNLLKKVSPMVDLSS